MRNSIWIKSTVVLSLSLLFLACSNKAPSYSGMGCSALIEKEKSLRGDLKLDAVSSIADAIIDVKEDTVYSAVDSMASDVNLDATQEELDKVKRLIEKKGCRK